MKRILYTLQKKNKYIDEPALFDGAYESNTVTAPKTTTFPVSIPAKTEKVYMLDFLLTLIFYINLYKRDKNDFCKLKI